MPNLRNWWHQKYCTQPECRKASKTESQRQWLSKPENRDVFRGSANVERVRQWRDENPGYWKRPAKPCRTLQELVAAPVPAQTPENKEVAPKLSSPPLPTASPPLQDFVQSQDPLVLGLISHLIDSPLQEVVIGVGMALSRHPSLQTGRADFPHPAFRSVVSRRDAGQLGHAQGCRPDVRCSPSQLRSARLQPLHSPCGH